MFKIEKCNKIKTKLNSEKIFPAIATTTAAIVGSVSLQLYTLYQTNDINYLRNCNIILSHNKIEFNNPVKYQKNENEGIIKSKKIQIPNSNNKNTLRRIIAIICLILALLIFRRN
jgi:hypothetical protein